jgi:rod shape-determining protein MreC
MVSCGRLAIGLSLDRQKFAEADYQSAAGYQPAPLGTPDMDFFLSRYRNLSVLLIVIVAQLLLIAYQVKSNKDVPMLRVWAVTAVTPVEASLEFVRRHTWGYVADYFVLLNVRSQNDKLKHENGQLKLENQYLKSELSTADRAQALSVFQSRSPSKTLAARVIGNGTGANSKVVFVDRGAASGVESGMAVVTPDGIVGKVVDAYPTASLVMLITDGNFAAGVVSAKNHVHGTLKGVGHSECQVDYVQNEERVDVGEWFYTSGDDRIFPKGFPVGQVTVVRTGKTFKEIYVTPSGVQGGVEEVLIVLQGVHQPVPDSAAATPGYKILPAPTESSAQTPQAAAGQPSVLVTDADKLREQYKQAAAEQKHVFGEGAPGSKPPDFTKIQGIRGSTPPSQAPTVSPKPVGAQPGASASNGGAQSGKSATATPPGTNPNTGASSKPQAADAVSAGAPPKAKPRPTAPILETDPTDADPGADAIPPALKSEKPATVKPPVTPQPPATKPPAVRPPNPGIND